MWLCLDLGLGLWLADPGVVVCVWGVGGVVGCVVTLLCPRCWVDDMKLLEENIHRA